MTTEEKNSLLASMFQGANLAGAQIIAVNEGEVYYQKYASGASGSTKTEDDVKNALDKLMNLKDDDGTYVMKEQLQWYAIFRVLSTLCGFPKTAVDFERTMVNLGADKMRVPCRYESFRKVAVHQLPQNVALWGQYLNTTDQYSKKQAVVAVKLMDILEIERQ
ncbi:MAG: hypothetical protein K6B45_01835 [Bacteroidaceae bacterium]|nr:hypothetical protein [Bacteroidaceae bacterium]